MYARGYFKIKNFVCFIKKEINTTNGVFLALSKLVEVLSSSHILGWLGLQISVDDV